MHDLADEARIKDSYKGIARNETEDAVFFAFFVYRRNETARIFTVAIGFFKKPCYNGENSLCGDIVPPDANGVIHLVNEGEMCK